MKKVRMKVIRTRRIAKDTIEMQLKDDYITEVARAGQFIYIQLPDFTLRRPISIADINKEKNQLTILFKILGKGTARLATYESGEFLDCIGPNGNGFSSFCNDTQSVLLLGGGIGVPPLYYLGKYLIEKGIQVTSILGFQSAEHIFYEKEFQRLGETLIVTDDGSYGEKGFVTDLIDSVPTFDIFYACGPTGMLRAVQHQLEGKKGYLSLEERMGCGIGACSACAVKSTDQDGYLRVCHDGPVFSAREVIL
jgi:dihydroorotate dehydrogenase electron transfer subunit